MEYLDTYKICLNCGKRKRIIFAQCDYGIKEFSANVVPRSGAPSGNR